MKLTWCKEFNGPELNWPGWCLGLYLPSLPVFNGTILDVEVELFSNTLFAIELSTTHVNLALFECWLHLWFAPAKLTFSPPKVWWFGRILKINIVIPFIEVLRLEIDRHIYQIAMLGFSLILSKSSY